MAEGLTPDRPPTPSGRARLDRRLVGPFSVGQALALLGAVVGVGLVLAVLTAPIAPGGGSTPRPGSSFFVVDDPTEGLQVGQRAPEFEGTVDGDQVGLVDLDGNPVRLADLRGHPVWINFWATWCPPCQEETPVLQRVFETHEAEGLIVLGVSVQETSPEDVRRYVETYGLTYRVGFDATSAVFKTYRAYGLPTQYFLDRDGVIRATHKGPLSEIEAERILAPIILGD